MRVWRDIRDSCNGGHCLLTVGGRAPSQYPKRRLSVWSRKVSKPRDLYLELSDRSETRQAPRQQCCRCACQISKRYNNLKYRSRGFETLRDLTERRLFGYWDGAQVARSQNWSRMCEIHLTKLSCAAQQVGIVHFYAVTEIKGLSLRLWWMREWRNLLTSPHVGYRWVIWAVASGASLKFGVQGASATNWFSRVNGTRDNGILLYMYYSRLAFTKSPNRKGLRKGY